jgi:bile acid:Na+ symporter, BASS family
MLITMLSILGRYATQLMAGTVFVALLLPDLAHMMKPLLGPSVWALLFVAMVRLDWRGVVGHLRRYRLIAASLIWILIICPMLVWVLTRNTGLPPGITTALVLTAASAPLMSTPSVSMMIGLDGSLALVTMVMATFLAPFTLPVLALELLKLDIEIGVAGMMLRLIGMVGSAFALALVFRHLVGQARIQRWWTGFDGVVVILMALFALAIMDGITVVLLAEPWRVLLVVIGSFVLNGGLQLISALVFRQITDQERYTLGFVSGMRNMGLILAVLPAGVDKDIVLYFAMAQFPIYILPALLKPLYRRLLTAKTKT